MASWSWMKDKEHACRESIKKNKAAYAMGMGALAKTLASLERMWPDTELESAWGSAAPVRINTLAPNLWTLRRARKKLARAQKRFLRIRRRAGT